MIASKISATWLRSAIYYFNQAVYSANNGCIPSNNGWQNKQQQ
jgi:hypothetical protein